MKGEHNRRSMWRITRSMVSACAMPSPWWAQITLADGSERQKELRGAQRRRRTEMEECREKGGSISMYMCRCMCRMPPLH